MSDPVRHPSHYAVGRFGIQCIAFTRYMTFSAGNAVKYVWRWQEKGGIEDLEKSLVYLTWANEDGLPSVLPGFEEYLEALLLKHVEPFIVPGFGYEAISLVVDGSFSSAKAAIEEVIRRNGPVLDQLSQ